MTHEADDTLTPIGAAAQRVFLALALATMRFADEPSRPERARFDPPFTPAGLRPTSTPGRETI